MLIFTYNTRIEALKIFQEYIQNTIDCVTTHTIHMFVECFFESGYVNQEKAIENIFI